MTKLNFLQARTLGRTLRLSPATITLLLAVLVGVSGGFGALLFKKLIFLLQDIFWAASDMTPETFYGIPWIKRLIMPVVGGLIVGPLIYFLAREAKGHGVPEVMIAVITRSSVIRPVVVVVKALASAVSISSGGSVGREGPIVQIGAAIASTLGQVLGVHPVQLKVLVGCGVAAGISGTFNAPIAGMLFALELIVSDFGLTAFTPILVSSVMATAITRYFQGNIIEFGSLPQFSMVSLWEFGLYLVLGVCCGAVGWLFSRSLYVADDMFEKTRTPQWLRPALGGACVGIAAVFMPHIMGVGYDTIRVLFTQHLTLGAMVLLVLLKLVMTAVTIGSGGSGGVFAPSLFIGAMLGGAFGTVVNGIMPHTTASAGAYTLVGMAAVNGACTLAPLSAIIILVELTNNYSMILPLMFTVVMATVISRKLNPESIYTEKLARRGINAHCGEDMNILRAIKVKDVLRHDEAVIEIQQSFEALINLALNARRNAIFVVDTQGRFRGAVSMQDLKHAMNDVAVFQESHKITDFLQEVRPVFQTQTLDTVIDLFADTDLDRLPVVDASGRLVGSVVMNDVIRSYNQEVVDRNMAMELGARIQAHDARSVVHLGSDTVLAEIGVPEWMVGRALGDLKLRSTYNVSIFVVKEMQPYGEPRIVTPSIAYVFCEGVHLLVGGKQEDIDRVMKNKS